MKRIIYLFLATITLTACTGGGSDGNNRSRHPKWAHELRFLRDAGINPDSLLITDSWAMPEGDDWETLHNRWLTMSQIIKLGLDQLCEADTSMSPITLMAVYPIDDHITLLILHQYLGDAAPVRLVTYDGDGIPMDYLNLGTCDGVNTIYWHESQQAAGVETASIAFAGRTMTVDRQLQLRGAQGDALWTATEVDTYEIDTRGYMMHRESRHNHADMDDDMQARRRIEAAGWYSIQDEQAMDAFSACHSAQPESSFLGIALWMRVQASPWTSAHWFYTHQDSGLIPVLAGEVKSLSDDDTTVQDVLDAVHDADQKAFLKKILSK